jgi:hypothetical protein
MVVPFFPAVTVTVTQKETRVAAMFVYVFLLLIAGHPTGLMSGWILFFLDVLCRFAWMWVVMY